MPMSMFLIASVDCLILKSLSSSTFLNLRLPIHGPSEFVKDTEKFVRHIP